MKMIYTDPLLYQTLIKKGFERQALFSWDKTADLLWKSCIKAMG
jgi:hypothetical protein